MKIFISYSTDDRWIAGKIREDLEKIRSPTVIVKVLIAEDFEPGEDFVQKITAAIRSCDEVLLLVSPSSLESSWVGKEEYAAIALGKKLVPILMGGVSENELPTELSSLNARDLNNIEEYYAYLRRTGEGEPPPPPIIEVGDRVRIEKPELPDDPRLRLRWLQRRDAFENRVATVKKVENKAAKLDIDRGRSWWAFQWLIPEKNG